MAIIDMDGDHIVDLVVGAPLASFPIPGRSHGEVLIYRGTPDGRFESEPAWSIHTDSSVRHDGAAFGAGLDVVRDNEQGSASALVVRSQGFAPRGPNGAALPAAGGLWVFAPGTLGPRSSAPHHVRVVTTKIARSAFFGAAPNRGVGRSATLGDVDGDGKRDYIVGCATGAAPGSVLTFSVANLLAGGKLTPTHEVTFGGNEMQGFRVATLHTSAGDGLASWAAWRTTPYGPFVGGIDYTPPGPAALAQWPHRSGLALPNFGASDRAGASVAFALAPSRKAAAKGAIAATPDLIVGTPGAHSPAERPSSSPLSGTPSTPSSPPQAGIRIRTGTVDIFHDGAAHAQERIWLDKGDAQLGGGPLAVLDFDGDGAPDVAVGDPNESAGGPPAAGFVDPDGCVALDAKGNPTNVGGRGVVRIYSLATGDAVERFRLTSPRETARADTPIYLRNRFGSSIAVADVNGDKKDDLIVGRAAQLGSSGAEVVLGRKADPTGKVVIACNTGENGARGALSVEPAVPNDPVVYGLSVAGLGDLDRDGCDEVAMSMTRANSPNNGPRAGVLVAFGFDGSGGRCGGHRSPFLLRLVADDHPLDNDVLGDSAPRQDDLSDLRGAPTGMGAVLAHGHGDFTGDGTPDLVFRDADLAVGDRRGPAVEVVSGAYLASLCPQRRCPQGRAGPLWADGDWRVLATRAIGSEHRRVIVGSAAHFGTAIALGDITGDGIADLAIGAYDDSEPAPFAGEVRVYRGGRISSTQGALAEGPWLIAVGDTRERGGFGTAVAVARDAEGWLAVGAPASSRWQTGGGIGAAFLFASPLAGEKAE
jgi:hypothetical protein